VHRRVQFPGSSSSIVLAIRGVLGLVSVTDAGDTDRKDYRAAMEERRRNAERGFASR
jgi:hypothetical protein